MQDALFAGYTDETAQWRAVTLHMVNWGGFHGHHSIDFAPTATLISGASGSGKSTLMDAYIALMMPSSVPFNGASNDATTGRARGEDQRNVLSYLRGKRDTTRHGDQVTDQVLRGPETPMWGAVAMTFEDDYQRIFTALRAYYVPAGATRQGDVTMKLFTFPTPIDPRELAAFADSKFDPRPMRHAFPDLSFHATVRDFTEHVTTRLGIGRGDGGERALRLLARIQAGHQVRTVDQLYKQMVLEKPGTYDAADRAVEQFRSLDSAYRDLVTDSEKEEALRRIGDLHVVLQAKRAEAERLSRLGIGQADENAPLNLWRHTTHERVLGDDIAALQQAKENAERAFDSAREDVARLERTRREVEEQQREHGGDRVQALESDIEALEVTLRRVTKDKKRFDEATRILGLKLRSHKDFEHAQETADQFLASVDAERRVLRDERDILVQSAVPLTERKTALRAEYASLLSRDDLVPATYIEARRVMAEAAGLTPSDLPFAAELMDVAPQWEEWRLAAEVTLRGIGLTVLVDERRQRSLREAINGIDLGQRISFEGVDITRDVADPEDPAYISGRLRFKDSPFAAWVKLRVASDKSDHLCVDSPADLGGYRPTVTKEGQTAQGSRGAHGRNAAHTNILGFSNHARRSEIESDVERLDARLADLDRRQHALEQAQHELEAKVRAFERVRSTTWQQIDTRAVNTALTARRKEHGELLSDSAVLATLADQLKDVTAELNEATRRKFGAESAVADAEKNVRQREVLLERAQQSRRDMLETSQVRLSENDRSYLDEILHAEEPELVATNFDAAMRRVSQMLTRELSASLTAANDAASSLEVIFASYNARWPDPNRGTTADAYEEFASIRDRIVHHGLYARKEAFRRQLQRWSGNDLKLLGDAFDQSFVDIEERLAPVNEILAKLPFGAQHDRLRIDLRRVGSESVTRFKKQLAALTADTDDKRTDEESTAHFLALREFMTSIASPDDGSTSQTRDDLLDVREHVEISAARVTAAGEEVSTYAVLGGKSGGESQELVAFIVGSALRFHLGDDTRTKPRFAPVFLDEAFVKADSEFAGRAVQAWKGLGFQLIVGAPLDKVTALEPHMEVTVATTKNVEQGYSYLARFIDADPHDASGKRSQTDGVNATYDLRGIEERSDRS